MLNILLSLVDCSFPNTYKTTSVAIVPIYVCGMNVLNDQIVYDKLFITKYLFLKAINAIEQHTL